MRSGEQHTFRITLVTGDLLQGRVHQHAVDAGVIILGPSGEILLNMDSPNGGQGEESVLAFADRSGEYRLIVAGRRTGWSGSYRLSIQEPRRASAADSVRVDAVRKMADGDLFAALQAFESIEDVWGQILVLERLALHFSDQRAHSEALAACSKGMVLAHDLGDPAAEGRLTNLAGLAHRSLREWRKARNLIERALDLAEKGEDLQGQALALNNLGLISEDRGELQEALEYYKASLDLWPVVGDPGEHARTLANLGEVYLALGQPSKALGVFNPALRLSKRSGRREVHYAAVDGAAMAFHDLGLFKKSFWFYRLALGLADRPEQRARTLHRLGSMYRDKHDLQKASILLEDALSLSRSVGDPRLEAYALAELGSVDLLHGLPLEALRKFDQARSLFEDEEVSLYVASSMFGRAESERDLGRLEDAVASVKRSVDIIEALRAGLMEPEPRVAFFASRHRFYDLYVELLMELGRHEEAFEANQNAQARTPLDDVAGGGQPATRGMTLEEIQRELLDDDSLLLVYSLGTRLSYLWAVRKDGLDTFKLPSRYTINEAALQAWNGLSDQGGEARIRELSRMLLPEGLDLRPGTRLLVSLDGALHLIPFSALYGPDGLRLVSGHRIAYEPSASVLVGMRRKLAFRPLAPKAVKVLADPVFGPDDERLGGMRPSVTPFRGERRGSEAARLPRLQFSEQEAGKILRYFPDGELALGFEANRSSVLDPALGDYQLLHFATHHLSGIDPERTGLVLSLFDERGRPIEGLVRATEVYNLKLPVELVVLSACGTGLAEEAQGEGPMGLPRAFFHAGAKRVVVSLWKVDDRVTAKLMGLFYHRMREDKLPPVEALRSAQATMAASQEWSHPRYWAPFILLGEPD